MSAPGTAPAGGLIPPDGPSAGAPQTRCVAAVPDVRHGVAVVTRCEDPAIPLTRYCAEHLIAHAGHP